MIPGDGDVGPAVIQQPNVLAHTPFLFVTGLDLEP